MPKITLIEHSGDAHVIEAQNGVSLMQNALDKLVPGIDADCGGACSCGTCHCYVEQNWRETLGDPDHMEESMLAMRPDRADNSRLSCQIEVSDDMDGLIVHLPEYQM